MKESWNQKFLDYEIETKEKTHVKAVSRDDIVGIKSFSITRLKHIGCKALNLPYFKLESKVSRLRD